MHRRYTHIVVALVTALFAVSGFAQEDPPSAQTFERPEDASPQALPAALPQGPDGDKIRAGWAIFDDTPAHLGAAFARRGASYDGNALSCRNCHLDHGTRPGAFPLVDFSSERRYNPRKGLPLSGAQRINVCVQRSLNASPLPERSQELAALVAYLSWIAAQGRPEESKEIALSALPDRRADFVTGENIFYGICAFCHGEGAAPGAPPLWGEQSYGLGSDLARLLVATRFIQRNMPPDGPALNAAQAYDAAAFVNARERPTPWGLDRDYPALSEKPVDVPYPPYPDFFSQEQHQFGPFGPIFELREHQRQADRWVYWIEHAPEAEAPLPLAAFELE